MQIVKLGAIDSTNAYLKRAMQLKHLEDYTVVQCARQTQGRGQQGAIWVSEAGKNLTFSLFKRFENLSASHHFYLNIIVSMAIYRTLKNLDVPDVYIKWPNDIMSGNTKICGILIETILAGTMIKSSVIGIGLNVNQTYFKNLPHASSLKLLLNKPIDVDKVLEMIVADLKCSFPFLKNLKLGQLKEKYESLLFKKDERIDFELPDGQKVNGRINGVSEIGKLAVTFDNGKSMEFGFKEVKMLY